MSRKLLCCSALQGKRLTSPHQLTWSCPSHDARFGISKIAVETVLHPAFTCLVQSVAVACDTSRLAVHAIFEQRRGYQLVKSAPQQRLHFVNPHREVSLSVQKHCERFEQTSSLHRSLQLFAKWVFLHFSRALSAAIAEVQAV